ncbi:MAG: heavy-metal-associated domain-containing protein [Leucothrix sp.]
MNNINSTIITIALVVGIGYAAVAIADMKDGMPCAYSQQSQMMTPANVATAKIATADQQKVNFNIDNMTCAACPITVSKAMKTVDGVEDVAIDFKSKTATVIFDPVKTNPELIGEASTKAGYPATLVTES